MAIPSFISHGEAQSGVGAITVPWPVGVHQADDIGILLVETSNQATATTLSDDQGFVEIENSPQGVGGGTGTGGENRLAAFWCRATGTTMGSPQVVDVGNHQIGAIMVFRGCITTGNPWSMTTGNVEGTSTSAVTLPGGTTTHADCLIVNCLTHGKDDDVPTVGGWTNPDLSDYAEILDSATLAGHGGTIAAAAGGLAAAGAFSDSTAALTSNQMQGRLTVALRPPAVAGGFTDPGYYRRHTQRYG